MKLLINDTMSVRDLQLAFNSWFPYLRMEFFRKGNDTGRKQPVNKLLPHHTTVGEIWQIKEAAEIEIDESTRVKDLEKTFLEKFGLSVQIFRKSGNLWLETTMTDNWTLRQQNEHGKEITLGKSKDEPKNDYNLNRNED